MNGTPTALELWRRRVAAHFTFLEEHGFALAPALDVANPTGLRASTRRRRPPSRSS